MFLLMYRADDKPAVKQAQEGLKAHSIHPRRIPWVKAPMGAVMRTMLYFALVWPEVMHQLEGGLMKNAIEFAVHKVHREGVGTLHDIPLYFKRIKLVYISVGLG